MVKVYKAHSILSVPLVVDGKISGYAEFKDENNTYRTSDEGKQTALEALPCYGSLFKLSETLENRIKSVKAEPVKKEKEYPDITDWQDAKELLRKEYNIPHQSLNTPENIQKKAAEVGALFPNLKTEINNDNSGDSK